MISLKKFTEAMEARITERYFGHILKRIEPKEFVIKQEMGHSGNKPVEDSVK